MLLEFSIANLRSFRELVTFSMLATHLKSAHDELNQRACFASYDSRTLLRTAVLYGANASGKSNLLLAMALMRSMIIHSARGQQGDRLPVQPFLLDDVSEGEPTHLEAVFLSEGIQYRYGFEVTSKAVLREWLYHRPSSRETLLFKREGQEIQLSGIFKEGRMLENKTRSNALFLSVVAQFNGELASRVLGWFQNRFIVVLGMNELALGVAHEAFTVSCFTEEALAPLREQVIQLLQRADLGIHGIEVERQATEVAIPTDMPESLRRAILEHTPTEVEKVRVVHPRFDQKGELVGTRTLDMENHESDGTRKMFRLAGPIVDTLKHGRVLLIDEMDARMHPLLTRAILDLFYSSQTNPHNAQLIFASHDVLLLDPKLFRRDQIWFVEKDRLGVSHLSSLAEFKDVRQDEAFHKSYMRGRYGAIPILRSFGFHLEE